MAENSQTKKNGLADLSQVLNKQEKTAEEIQFITKKYLYLATDTAQRIYSKLPTNCEVECGDLINWGVIGLIDAIKKFRPEKGVKLQTFASSRVYGEIMDNLRDIDWLPRSIRKKIKDSKNDQAITDNQRVKPPKIRSLDQTTDIIDYNVNDNRDLEWEITRKSNQFNIEESAVYDQVIGSLNEAIESMNENWQLIIFLYYDEEMTMKEIGETLNVSESRVSQIHSAIIKRLRYKLRNLKGIKDTLYYLNQNHQQSCSSEIDPRLFIILPASPKR